MWETWWCGTSIMFLTFQFFYYYVQVSPRCDRLKINFFSLLFIEVIVEIPMCSF